MVLFHKWNFRWLRFFLGFLREFGQLFGLFQVLGSKRRQVAVSFYPNRAKVAVLYFRYPAEAVTVPVRKYLNSPVFLWVVNHGLVILGIPCSRGCSRSVSVGGNRGRCARRSWQGSGFYSPSFCVSLSLSVVAVPALGPAHILRLGIRPVFRLETRRVERRSTRDIGKGRYLNARVRSRI